MSRFMAMSGVLCAMAGLCLADAWGQEKQKGKKADSKAAAQANPLDDFTIGEPIRHANLAVFPVMSKTPKNEDRYLTLEEGLKDKTVEVFEVGAQPSMAPNSAAQPPAAQPPDQTAPNAAPRERQTRQSAPANRTANRPGGERNAPAQQSADPFGGENAYGPMGDVNRLMVVNRSKKPLYLMPGELIYGGRQDRCIAEETIIAANGKPTPVQVFCVEHGRWALRGEAETTAELSRLVAGSGEKPDEETLKQLAAEAKKGKFVAQAGSLNKAGRVAVQGLNSQSEVWEKVGQANRASGVAAPSDAYTANYTSPQVLKQLEGYMKALDEPVTKTEQVVGAIVAVNGKVESVDIFQSTPLFRKIWPKILRGHAFDAASVASQKNAKKTNTVKDAQAFMLAAMKAGEEKRSVGAGGIVVTKRDSKSVMSFSASERNAASPSMGGMGDAVHSAGYAK